MRFPRRRDKPGRFAGVDAGDPRYDACDRSLFDWLRSRRRAR